MYSRHFTRSGRESGRPPGFRGSHHVIARKKAAPARRFFSRPASVAWEPAGPARRTRVSRGWRRRGVGRPGWSPRRSPAGAAAPCCARRSWDLRCSRGPATVPAPAVRLMAGAQGVRTAFPRVAGPVALSRGFRPAGWALPLAPSSPGVAFGLVGVSGGRLRRERLGCIWTSPHPVISMFALSNVGSWRPTVVVPVGGAGNCMKTRTLSPASRVDRPVVVRGWPLVSRST